MLPPAASPEPVDVLAVIGICAPERRRCAERLADREGRDLLPLAHRIPEPGILEEAARLCLWSGSGGRAVVELPTAATSHDIWPEFALVDGVHLSGIVGVVDVMHLRRDLADLRYMATQVRRERGVSVGGIARAMQLVLQIEAATVLELVNVGAGDLREVCSLLALLNPGAVLRAEGTVVEAAPVIPALIEPGWHRQLRRGADGHGIVDGVGWVRCSQLRPFHPARLQRVLEDRLDAGDFGTVLRSAGWIQVASRPEAWGRWQQVGRFCSWERHGLRGRSEQALVLYGLDLDVEALRDALAAAVLDDAELLAGPELWRSLEDPLPPW